VGRTKLTGQGRPALRLAAWRAVWGTQRGKPVYAARYQHLTKRETNRLTATQAQTVIAAAILRQPHAVITTGQAWDPHIATHGTPPAQAADTSRLIPCPGGQAGGRGEPARH
jgi:transposase